jgi:ABC-2 type transport system permease protein
MVKYIKTAQMVHFEKTNGGIIYLLPDVIIKIFTLIPLVFLWKVVMLSGVDVGMSMQQMLTYAYVSSLLSDMMVVNTPASGWLSEGVLMRLYGRPLSIIGQLISQTVGGWIPMLFMFSLPMAIVAPLVGVNLRPASLWFFISLFLCISLGFAIDILFACLSIKLRNTSWLISRIRAAIVSLLSGTIIPVSLLPLGFDRIVKYQPFASLGGAPLSIFVGASDPLSILKVQIFWNLILWPFALLVFKKSQEGMVSYGG